MSQLDKQKWDQRHAEGDHPHGADPSEWLLRALAMAHIDNGAGRRALDVACGTGRNALYLAGLGFEVDAVDISPVGLALAKSLAQKRGLVVNWLEADLELSFDPPGTYDLIVMFHYVNMPLLQNLIGHLKPGGWFVGQQHLDTDAEVVGPSSARFRLAPGVLAQACAPLRIHHQEEGIFVSNEGDNMALAKVLAQRAT